ncbi:MAG: aminotransferase class III-fold pyridoxal phosphate-dependent enzyme [Terriglobales bacterium]
MMRTARVTGRVSEAEATRLAREIYALDATAHMLPGEYDDNFRMVAASGHTFVLKVMSAAREPGFVAMQSCALQHLARRAPQLNLPRVIPTQAGEAFTSAAQHDGTPRLIWMLTYLPGTVLADARPHTIELFTSLGCLLGEIDGALLDFAHPGADRELPWDLARAGAARAGLHHIADPARRALAERFLDLYDREVAPRIPQLRRSVIYGDANDYNVIVGAPGLPPRTVAGVIDFGDMHHGLTVAEPAIAAAYAMFGKADPLAAASAIVAGYHRVLPLQEAELAALYPLMGARLAVSVVNSAHRKTLKPEDPYVTISEAPAWKTLARLARIHPRWAHYRLGAACDLAHTGRPTHRPAPAPQSRGARPRFLGAARRWLKSSGKAATSILDADLRTQPCRVFDLSAGSTFLGANPQAADTAGLSEAIFGEMRRAGAAVGVGRYLEARLLYTSPLFGAPGKPTAERRTIHLGLDLFVAPGTSLRAPLSAVVHVVARNAAPLDYGHVVILRHANPGGQEFFTLYGHLAHEVMAQLRVGQALAQGQAFARVGGPEENGGWPPHVHFQIILDLLELGAQFPGVCKASEQTVWSMLCPDPNLLLGIPAAAFPPVAAPAAGTLAARKVLLGNNLSVAYRHPLKIVRGWMQYLYDDSGRAYLDAFNNVPLVGHSHPRVVQAAQQQLGLLNTNTRYLHDTVVHYAQRLTELLPEPLRVCYFLNSGSEANELALRLARTRTGREDILVLEHAYHGHTSTLVDISPYKFDGPGGGGRKPWVHVAPLADDYRGPYRRGDAQAGARYARHIAQIFERVGAQGRAIAAFIAETLPSVAGQIVFPPGYLAAAYGHVRAAGALCIADEVQAGFGRLGKHLWGFESQDVVPDIVVLGKPIANGFPLAAVVTTREIAASFDNGMEFFSTFGGNPVSVAAGLAVLDVLAGEGLQQNAGRVGHALQARLLDLQTRHELLGDVRGMGLFLGLDLVRDRTTRAPATEEAAYITNRLRDRGILTGTDGPHHNVIKLRPPLCFSAADADLLVAVLDSVLAEDAAQPRRR